MARLILQSGDGAGDIGNSAVVDVIGTNAAETINVSANGRGTFDGSFTRGNDIIDIDGNAANYSIRQTGPNQIVITNAAGANLIIPVGTGVTIKFNDVDAGRVLAFNSAGTEILLGSQAVSSTASTITAGGGGGGGGSTGSEFFLGVAQDVLVGTAFADTFVADLIQNPLGEQTNALGTGDRLTGGNGEDTLEAHLQDASPLNGGPGSAIAPITSSVEVIYVTADQAYDGDDEDRTGIALGVEVNARRMTGVTDLGSVFSDTSMTYYNVNTLASGAAIGDESTARRTGVMTVRMERTGASTPVNDAANLTVLFDNDYLRPDDSVTSGAQLHVQMMDLDAAILEAPASPLRDNPYTSFIFKVGDTQVSIAIPETADTYAQLLAAFQAALAANPVTAGKVTAALGPVFVANDTDSDPGGSQQGTEILLTNSGPEPLTAVQFIAANGVPSDLDFHLQTYNAPPGTEDRLIEVDVELDKVGNGGDLGDVTDGVVHAGGGYLTIGGMQTDDEHYEDSIVNNTWKNGAVANPGVEQFNITVEGTAIEDSSLAGIQSTHNALRVIVLDNPGSTADLIVGNSNTRYASNVNGAIDTSNRGEGGRDPNSADLTDVRNNAIKDVMVFDASAFTANSAVYGHFSDEVVAKYLNIVDAQANPRADNAQGEWTFGSGNNLVNLNISKVNAAFDGATTREDFELDIDTNAGDDVVQLQFGDGTDSNSGWFQGGSAPVGNWYTNTAINAFRYVGGIARTNDRYADMQINVDTGANNDVVELWGSSVVHAVLGSGDDVIYTDNSGGGFGNSINMNGLTAGFEDGGHKATWVFNSMDDNTWDVEHLQSQTRVSVTGIANLGLLVTFQDIEVRVPVIVGGSTASGAGVTITDLTINQAIKDAINNDPIMSHLLIAKDGPSGTLIVQSLVDGEHVESDLVLHLYNVQPLQPGQTGHLITAAELNTLGWNADGTPQDTGDDDRWDSDFGILSGYGDLTGEDSVQTNNNVVEGGTGNDIIVLSTHGEQEEFGRQPTGSVETVDINAPFGFDTILNFTAAVGVGGVSEVQTIDFNGQVNQRPGTPPTDQTGTATVTLPSGLGTYTITVDSVAGGANPTTAAEVAAAFAALINADLSNDVTATADANGVLTLNYNDPGVNYAQATAVETPTLPVSEVQHIDIGGTAQTAAATVVLTFPGLGAVSLAVGGTTGLTTPAQIATALEPLIDAFFGSNVAVLTDADTITITYPGDTDYAQVQGSVILSNDVQVNITTFTDANGIPFGLTDVEATTIQGLPPVNGADIFDLTTVMGAPVAANFFNFQPGNGAEEDGATWAEPTHVAYATLNGGSIIITDTLSAADFGAGAPTTEEARINALANAADTTATGGSNPATKYSVVITVDHDNVGHFYLITNGTAARDAFATKLGDVELATYDDPAKAAVGDWDQMTITNFTPLTAETVVTTFTIA